MGKAAGRRLPLRTNPKAQSHAPQVLDVVDSRRTQCLLGATGHPLLPIHRPYPPISCTLLQLYLTYQEATWLLTQPSRTFQSLAWKQTEKTCRRPHSGSQSHPTSHALHTHRHRQNTHLGLGQLWSSTQPWRFLAVSSWSLVSSCMKCG